VKVCVQGLWHLGVVTAACLAEKGHEVVGLDRDAAVVEGLAGGRLPVAEPGLDDLVRRNAAAGRLTFSADPAAASGAEVLWVAYDTPVDQDDVADVELVIREVEAVLPRLRDGATVLVSSQLPVGSVARLEAWAARHRPGAGLGFACAPENLRLGKAVQVFLEPDRVVVGARDAAVRARVAALLAPVTDRIEWMSVESAEMTKHALNAFLAVSVTFANEIAQVCERVGADAKEVERGLKTEARVGPKAYLAPGGAFAGGTLARDVAFLAALAEEGGLSLPLLAGVRPSNERHKGWALRHVEAALPRGAAVAVWGLTYKPGTDTLRRSAAVELCSALADRGFAVRAHDPAVRVLPADLAARVELRPTPEEAARGASALVVATEWPAYRAVDLAGAIGGMARPLVLDPNRFLAERVRGLAVEYRAVGTPGARGEGRARG
jgi:UDPglucose 6-dehydrogenase